MRLAACACQAPMQPSAQACSPAARRAEGVGVQLQFWCVAGQCSQTRASCIAAAEAPGAACRPGRGRACLQKLRLHVRSFTPFYSTKLACKTFEAFNTQLTNHEWHARACVRQKPMLFRCVCPRSLVLGQEAGVELGQALHHAAHRVAGRKGARWLRWCTGARTRTHAQARTRTLTRLNAPANVSFTGQERGAEVVRAIHLHARVGQCALGRMRHHAAQPLACTWSAPPAHKPHATAQHTHLPKARTRHHHNARGLEQLHAVHPVRGLACVHTGSAGSATQKPVVVRTISSRVCRGRVCCAKVDGAREEAC